MEDSADIVVLNVPNALEHLSIVRDVNQATIFTVMPAGKIAHLVCLLMTRIFASLAEGKIV